MFSRLPLTTLLLSTFILAACRPSTGQEEEQQKTVTKNGIPLPPELIEATGLGTKDERGEIILLLPDGSIAMQDFQRNGLAMLVGRQAGYKVTTEDAKGSSAKQVEQFRSAIAAKPAAIFVEPVDPPALAALIVEAQSSGITVIGLDKRMLKDGCTSVVFSDQRVVGRLAAQTVLEALKRKAEEEGRTEVTGRVVELRGAENNYATGEIAEGFSEGLRAQPGVIVVHDAAADWNAESAAKRTNEALQLQKSFDAIYAHSDVMALAAAKTVEAAGIRENMLVVGTDGISGQPKGIERVRAGEIDATIVQPALVDLALQIIVKMRADEHFKPQPAYEIEPVAVVPRNVEQSLRAGTYKLPAL